MILHIAKCDLCFNKEGAVYNGEHHLPPEGWSEIVDAHTGVITGHLCKACTKKLKLENDEGEK